MPDLVVALRTGLRALVAVVLLADANAALAQEAPPADTSGWDRAVSPLQLALYEPIQVFSPATRVRGMRFNLVYGEQGSVWGIDSGLTNKTTADMIGMQHGLVNWNHDVTGFQTGALNWGTGNFVGSQIGAINLTEDDEESLQVGMRVNVIFGYTPRLWGLDAGLLNMTSLEMRGIQTGLMNTSLGDARGLQLGGANWVEEDFKGAQAGFINVVAGNSKSVQLGFVNTSKSLKGVQIGVLNFNETGQPLPFSPGINIGW